MSNYSFWEHLKDEDRVKLIKLNYELYGLKLDIMIMPVAPVTYKPLFPTSDECEKHMKQRPHHVKRVA